MTGPDRRTEVPAEHAAARLHLVTLDVPDAGPLHVLVLADDPLARAGLASFFADADGYALAGTTALDEDLDAAVEAFRPDVVLWDFGVGDAGAPDLAPLLDAAVPIVALVPDEDRADAAWTAGARALLLRSAARDHILTALFAVQRGLVVIDPDLADAVIGLRTIMPDGPDLTPREQEVLALVAEGLPNKGIADRLDITEHTVKYHVAALLSKLGAQSRTEAVVVAARSGRLIV